MAASSDVCLTEEERNLNFSICNAINDLHEKKTRADFNNVTKQLEVDIEKITVALEYLCATGKVLKKERSGHEYYSVEREVWCGIQEENHDNVKKPTSYGNENPDSSKNGEEGYLKELEKDTETFSFIENVIQQVADLKEYIAFEIFNLKKHKTSSETSELLTHLKGEGN